MEGVAPHLPPKGQGGVERVLRYGAQPHHARYRCPQWGHGRAIVPFCPHHDRTHELSKPTMALPEAFSLEKGA